MFCLKSQIANKKIGQPRRIKNVSTDSVCRCNATDKLNITLSVRATEPGKLSFVNLNIKALIFDCNGDWIDIGDR